MHGVQRIVARGCGSCGIEEDLGYLVELFQCLGKLTKAISGVTPLFINLFLFPLRGTKPCDVCPSGFRLTFVLESRALGFSELKEIDCVKV